MTTLLIDEPQDPIWPALAAAAILHAVFIFTVGWEIPAPAEPSIAQNLEIILVHHKSKDRPDDAAALAQVNLDSGGDTATQQRSASPHSSAIPVEERARSLKTRITQIPKPTQSQTRILTSNYLDQITATQPAQDQIDPMRPNPDSAEQMEKSIELARLSAEISPRFLNDGGRARHKFVNARTQEFKYASYMDAWRRKVERVGNLNYPEEARRRGLQGGLVLDVALDPEGKVIEIKLLRSSGVPVLDDAAIRIVELASPFAPLPNNIREDTDVLHIIRTWQFQDNHRLSSHR